MLTCSDHATKRFIQRALGFKVDEDNIDEFDRDFGRKLILESLSEIKDVNVKYEVELDDWPGIMAVIDNRCVLTIKNKAHPYDTEHMKRLDAHAEKEGFYAAPIKCAGKRTNLRKGGIVKRKDR